MEKIRLGISACLLGEHVRYDGGHKFDRYLGDFLGRFVDYVPVCPEVESGLPVPREPMRLEGDPAAPRLVTIKTGIDMTGKMLDWTTRRLAELEEEGLCGFIFKSNSPSSGMERVRIFDRRGVPRRIGTGIFAREFMARFALVPVEDEQRLHDPGLRENFIERIFFYRRWLDFTENEKSTADLIDFHTRHKLLVMAHSPRHYSAIGKLIAVGCALPNEELFDRYGKLFMEAMKPRATVARNTNVLQHLAGYFKKDLCAGDKQELGELIKLYRLGHLPLIVPITLINHYVRKYDKAYLKQQYYLDPHPVELLLRYHS